MTGTAWRWAEAAARMLPGAEREAVLGDLAEAAEVGWRGFWSVLGLVVRRECEPWRGWRPWATGFGLALPSSFSLMGLSLAVSWAFQRLMRVSGDGEGIAAILFSFFCQALFVAGLSWCGGFVAASVSRRTLWMSGLLCLAPCCYCLSRFRIEALSPWCLVLFLLPALVGVGCGLGGWKLSRRWGLGLARGLTAMALPVWRCSGISLCVLLWPAWFLATGRQGRKQI